MVQDGLMSANGWGEVLCLNPCCSLGDCRTHSLQRSSAIVHLHLHFSDVPSKGKLKTFKNASQILLWVLQKGERITGTAKVPGVDAAMRMLRHSCQLKILKWSGRGDSPFFKCCKFCSLFASFYLHFFLTSSFPKWCDCNITGCTHGNSSFPGKGCKVFVFWVGFHGLRPNPLVLVHIFIVC